MNLEMMQAWTRINEGKFVSYWMGDKYGASTAFKVEGFYTWEEAQNRLQELERKLYENGYRMYAMQSGYHLFQKVA